MQKVKNSCGERMKLRLASFGLLCLVFLASPSLAFGQSLKAVEDELGNIETELAAADSDRDTLSELAEAVNSGKIILIPGIGGYVPLTAEQHAQHLLLRLLEGKLSRKELKRDIAALAEYKSASVRAIRELQKDFEARVTLLKDRRSYLITERARLGEASMSNGNVTGDWSLVCCSQKYRATVSLIQNGTKISGSFSDGSQIEGEIIGNRLTFRRRFSAGTQDYVLELGTDGKTLTGTFSGDRDTAVGVDTTLTKISQ